MTRKIREIDQRNQLHGFMKYQITCSLPWFFNVREWCWSQFGPGIEYEHFHNYRLYTNTQMSWAWDCSKFNGASINNGKIYLPNDNSLALFELVWSE